MNRLRLIPTTYELPQPLIIVLTIPERPEIFSTWRPTCIKQLTTLVKALVYDYSDNLYIVPNVLKPKSVVLSIKSKPNEVTDQGIFEQRLRSVEKPLTFAKFLR